MPSVGLHSYIVTVRRSNARELEALDSINDSEDLFGVLTDWFQARTGTDIVHTGLRQYMLPGPPTIGKNRTISGIIETGPWGYTSQFRDRKTKKHRMNRKRDDAELVPLYYLVSIPPNSYEGLVLIQSFGHHGMKSMLHQELTQHIHAHMQDKQYTVALNPVIPRRIIDDAARGRVSKLKMYQFAKKKIPSGERVSLDYGGKKYKEMQVILTPEDGKVIVPKASLRKVLTGKISLSDFVAVPDFIEPDKIELEVDVDGRRKTVTVGTGRTHPGLVITDLVSSEGDHPSFGSIDKFSRSYLKEIQREMDAGTLLRSK